MADENNLIEALKTILDCVDKSDSSEEVIEAIEAENEKLRLEKFELLTKLNQLLKVKPSQRVLVKSLTSQLQTQKEVHAEFQQISSMRIKESSQRASDQIILCKQRLKQAESSMILPYEEVVDKINEIERETENNQLKSKNLSEECKNKMQHLMNLKKFSETLKSIEKDQKKQLEKVRKN